MKDIDDKLWAADAIKKKSEKLERASKTSKGSKDGSKKSEKNPEFSKKIMNRELLKVEDKIEGAL